MRSPYPLQWPDGWKRTTGYRDLPRFHAQFARDRDNVIRQLERFGASHVVITSDLPTRNDGLPYANASCSDPGVAVYWVKRGKEMVIACDRWRHVQYNLRAIDMTIDAIRGIDRWGASTMVERAFAGFAALPPGVPLGPVKRPWREVLGLSVLEGSLLHVKQAHRDLIRKHHPDLGGDHAIAAELNAALEEAERELGREARA